MAWLCIEYSRGIRKCNVCDGNIEKGEAMVRMHWQRRSYGQSYQNLCYLCVVDLGEALASHNESGGTTDAKRLYNHRTEQRHNENNRPRDGVDYNYSG